LLLHTPEDIFNLSRQSVLENYLKSAVAAIFCSLQFVLTTLREKLVNNLNMSKTEKMKLFSVANLKPILQLCTKWKPPGVKPEDEVPIS
jgi:hypothetical protein